LGEVFIWIGKQSTRLVRAAALKLAHELTALITRPAFAVVTKISEGNLCLSINIFIFPSPLNEIARSFKLKVTMFNN
jgi:hypothetical protein